MNEINLTEETVPLDRPLAIVRGEPFTELPHDLYIPPDALEVLLETFEGPLDLLLYLIRRENLNILDVPVAKVTEQYMAYIGLMHEMKLELAAEYLVMAAMLAEIKSRMLLPRPITAEEEEDPRAELIRRLQEYERYQKAAQEMDGLPRLERDIRTVVVEFPDRRVSRPLPDLPLEALRKAMLEVLSRANMYAHHQVQREPLSVRERMVKVLNLLSLGGPIEFTCLFTPEEGRMGVVVAFLAILQLLKEALIDIIQEDPAGTIYVKAAA